MCVCANPGSKEIVANPDSGNTFSWVLRFFHAFRLFIPQGNMIATEQYVKDKIKAGKVIRFVEGNLDSYLYHIYTNVLPKNKVRK